MAASLLLEERQGGMLQDIEATDSATAAGGSFDSAESAAADGTVVGAASSIALAVA